MGKLHHIYQLTCSIPQELIAAQACTLGKYLDAFKVIGKVNSLQSRQLLLWSSGANMKLIRC